MAVTFSALKLSAAGSFRTLVTVRLPTVTTPEGSNIHKQGKD
jgi:hypothetical protein